MAGPVISVNSVNQINASSFIEKSTNKLQNGKIRLGNTVYNVKFDNGKIKVGYQNWFLNLFRPNRSNEIKARLQSKLTAKGFVANESYNLAKKIGKDAGIRQVVLYGMNQVRLYGKQAIDKAVDDLKQEGRSGFKVTNIDTYNASLGIEWDDVSKDPVSMFNKIRNGDLGLSEEQFENYKDSIEDDTRKEWKQYLKDNADKVDIFKKVADFIHEGTNTNVKEAKITGWAGQVRKYGIDETLKEFILKQMGPDERESKLNDGTIDTYVKILRECVDKVNEGNLSKEEYAAIMDKYYPHRNEKVDKVTYHLDHRKVRDFGDMLTNAFFRQTSKLGIKFFQTFSEMRQVQRMEKELGEKNLNVIKTKGSRDSKINNLY